MKRTGSAVWRGAGATGSGELTTTSGALKALPYSAKLRFEGEDGRAGTNPEELIAAAHAGCFSMSLAFRISAAGFTAESLETTADVDFQKTDAGWTFMGITLRVRARVPGLENAKLQELAAVAKAGCPVSRALGSVPITLEATLA
jgi:osmotically inducible protein OsmC